MFLENYYITYSNDFIIHSISSYRNIMNKFILKFISDKKINYMDKNELFSDAILYSKYYLYWKTYSCVYQEHIMNVLYDIEYIQYPLNPT